MIRIPPPVIEWKWPTTTTDQCLFFGGCGAALELAWSLPLLHCTAGYRDEATRSMNGWLAWMMMVSESVTNCRIIKSFFDNSHHCHQLLECITSSSGALWTIWKVCEWTLYPHCRGWVSLVIWQLIERDFLPLYRVHTILISVRLHSAYSVGGICFIDSACHRIRTWTEIYPRAVWNVRVVVYES